MQFLLIALNVAGVGLAVFTPSTFLLARLYKRQSEQTQPPIEALRGVAQLDNSRSSRGDVSLPCVIAGIGPS